MFSKPKYEVHCCLVVSEYVSEYQQEGVRSQLMC